MLRLKHMIGHGFAVDSEVEVAREDGELLFKGQRRADSWLNPEEVTEGAIFVEHEERLNTSELTGLVITHSITKLPDGEYVDHTYINFMRGTDCFTYKADVDVDGYESIKVVYEDIMHMIKNGNNEGGERS